MNASIPFLQRQVAQTRILVVRLLIIALAALVAAWYWALPPLLTPLFYIHSTNWTDADLVRAIWHFRLVQPEWVSMPPDYLRWAQAETLARLAVVFMLWVMSSAVLIRTSGLPIARLIRIPERLGA